MIGVGTSDDVLEGFDVVSASGRRIGRVAGVSETTIVIEMRRFGRTTYRPLPREFALIWTRSRTVIAQLSARELRHAPALRRARRAASSR